MIHIVSRKERAAEARDQRKAQRIALCMPVMAVALFMSGCASMTPFSPATGFSAGNEAVIYLFNNTGDSFKVYVFQEDFQKISDYFENINPLSMGIPELFKKGNGAFGVQGGNASPAICYMARPVPAASVLIVEYVFGYNSTSYRWKEFPLDNLEAGKSYYLEVSSGPRIKQVDEETALKLFKGPGARYCMQ